MNIAKLLSLLALTAICTTPLSLTSCGGSSSSSSSSDESENELLEPFSMLSTASHAPLFPSDPLYFTPMTQTEGSARLEPFYPALEEVIGGSYVWSTPPSAESDQAVMKLRLDGTRGHKVYYEITMTFTSDTEATSSIIVRTIEDDGSLSEDYHTVNPTLKFSKKLY